MKYALLLLLLPAVIHAQASFEPKRIYFVRIDSIQTGVNYYVNVEAELGEGSLRLMDTNMIAIVADHGKMAGTKWIAPATINFQKVHFRAYWRMNHEILADTTVWLKRSKHHDDGVNMALPVVPKNLRKRRR